MHAVQALPSVTLTVAADRPEYYMVMDTVHLSGNLSLDGVPVPAGLVALEVTNPFFEPLVFRTVQIGEVPPSALAMNITSLFLSDSQGNPKNKANIGPFISYFSITVKNIGNETLSPRITVNIFQGPYPFYKTWLSISSFNPGGILSFIHSFNIPSWVEPGSAAIYANTYSNRSVFGGVPYSLERNATFQIVDPTNPGAGNSLPPSVSSGANGTYRLTFDVPVNAGADGFRQGTYTVYVSSLVASQLVTNSTSFVAKLPGDCNNDSTVDWQDVLLEFAPAYQSQPGDPNWNPNADFNGDDVVNWMDLLLYIAPFYGTTA